MEQSWEKVTLGQRWNRTRPTKAVALWLGMGSALVTTIVGFTWGGWVMGSTARSMAEAAVVSRLAPICVAQFEEDPGKDQKLAGWKEMGYWDRGEHVKKQGWATMPGDMEPDSRVADECARLLARDS